MELGRRRNGIAPESTGPHLVGRWRLCDLKTDIFLAANVMDAVITYLALRQGRDVTEFNSILSGIMDTIGIGPTLLLKVVLCVGILWLLRKTKKERLLVPLSIVLAAVAISNLVVARAQGIPV